MPKKNGSYEHVDTTEGDNEILSHLPDDVEPLELSGMRFFVISSKRAKNVPDMEKALEACDPTWIVGTGETEAYGAMGARRILEGGGLCASRNLGLETAFAENKVCIQLSDDLQHITFYHHPRDDALPFIKPINLNEANKFAAESTSGPVSIRIAAKALEAHARSRGAFLAGTFPNGNSGQACAAAPIVTEHFVVGDFIVVRPSTPRFDESMTLKEDYDFTAQHLYLHHQICRYNRLTLLANHYTNEGGAVAVRNNAREKKNIRLLRKKWPGVFLNSPRGPTEVVMKWSARDVDLGGERTFEPDPKQPGRSLYGEAAIQARIKRLAKEEANKHNLKHLAATTPKDDDDDDDDDALEASDSSEHHSTHNKRQRELQEPLTHPALSSSTSRRLRPRTTRTSMKAAAAAASSS